MPEFDAPPLSWKPVPRPIPIPLRGRTVKLEPLDAARHTPALWEQFRGQDELWTWMGDGPFAREGELRQAVAKKQAASDAVFFALVPAALGRAAGWASFLRTDPANGVIEIGNIVYGPVLQRTTAATEAMYLMARHIFDDLGYRRYEWKCNAQNLPSRRAAERLGFTFEGVFRQHMVVKDRSRDTAWFALLDRDWPARRQALEAWLAEENFDEHQQQRRPILRTSEIRKDT